MSNLIVYESFIKQVFMNFCISYLFIKITNYKDISKLRGVIILLNIIITTTLYSLLKNQINFLFLYIISYFFYIVIIKCITKKRIFYVMVIVIISFGISFLGFFIGSSIAFTFLRIFNINEGPTYFFVIGILQTASIYLLFKIKRFRNGFSFFQEDYKIAYIGKIGVSISIFIVTLYLLIPGSTDEYTSKSFIIIVFCGFLIINWIIDKITEYYKSKLMNEEIKKLQQKIEDKNKEQEDLINKINNVSKVNHSYSNRISALELKFSQISDISEENLSLLNSVKELRKKFEEESGHIEMTTSTNISEIDNMLNFMKLEAKKHNIDFELKITGDINYLIKSFIEKDKLEILIGDHVKNAIIAINSSCSEYRKIKTVIGKQDKYYCLEIHDTGIEFEINTLLDLGLKYITTHKNTGGTGIGFITTFETLRHTKASLIIEEIEPTSNQYTKVVIIQFDGKQDYIIKSYRADKIKSCNKGSRIKIISK